MNYTKLKEATKDRVKTTGVSAFSELELSKIHPNPEQPRKEFDDVLLQELAQSISTQGLIQPIAVVKEGNGYKIVSGERRYRAVTLLGQKTIKTHILQVGDKAIKEIALVENIQRSNLTVMEEAMYILELQQTGEYTGKDLANIIGKSTTYISKAIKATKLSALVMEAVKESNKKIGLEVLQELSGIKSEAKQLQLLEDGATRETIRLVKKIEKGEVKRDEVKKTNIYTATLASQREYASQYRNILRDDEPDIPLIVSASSSLFIIGKKYKITIEEIT